jgi:hypothetical protein
VNIKDSSWYLEDDVDAQGQKCKILCVTLVRPGVTEDEIKWKKGVRQDNRQGKRPEGMNKKGYRFFIDDEDEYGLEDYLQAICLLDCGKTYVPSKPWDPYQESRWTSNPLETSSQAQQFIHLLQNQMKSE